MDHHSVASLLETHLGERFAPDLREAIVRQGTLQHIQTGDILLDVGMPIAAMPIVLTGALKVMREDGSEGELLLYYLSPGDTCATSLTCCLQRKISQIRATAEEDSLILMLPGHYLNEWIGRGVAPDEKTGTGRPN